MIEIAPICFGNDSKIRFVNLSLVTVSHCQTYFLKKSLFFHRTYQINFSSNVCIASVLPRRKIVRLRRICKDIFLLNLQIMRPCIIFFNFKLFIIQITCFEVHNVDISSNRALKNKSTVFRLSLFLWLYPSRN